MNNNIGVVTLSVDSTGGGVSSVVAEHIAILSPSWNVSVYSSELNNDEKLDSRLECSNLFLSKSIFKGKFKILLGANKHILHSDLNLIHQHGIWNFTSILANRFVGVTNKPLVISPHGMLEPWILKSGYFKKQLMKFFFQNKNIFKAAAMHALTRSEAKDIRAFGYKGPIAIIPNGVHVDDAYTDKQFNKDFIAITYLGRIHPKKNINSLIEAITLLQNNEKKIQLNIYGWGESKHESDLKELIKDIENVSFHGSVYSKEKEEVFKSTDLFVLPSFSEGLPMVVLEAWSYGVPVMMTKACNLEDSFKAGVAIEIATDACAISKEISSFSVLESNELINISKKSLEYVRNNYSLDSIQYDLNSLYRWVLGSTDSPSFLYQED